MASTQLDTKKRLALAIVDFLQTSLKDGTLKPDDAESIEIATSCIAESFHIDPTSKAQMTDAIGSQSLLQIYSVYEKLKGGSSSSSSSKSDLSSSSSTAPPPSTPSPSTTTPESESLKSAGNAAMARKDYTTAISSYTSALDISPANPIYLSNRAAAYSASHKHDMAVADAELAVAADPKYTKAWSRLGLAKFVLGDARGAMEAYQMGIEAEGNGGSEAMKKGFKTAKEKVEELEREGEEGGKNGLEEEAVDDAPGGSRGMGGGGMPDLSALAGMFGGGGGGGGGGMPDMSSIMNNPMFASMAQNLMQNPQAMQGLMNNPQLRGMADRMGMGGGGAGPGAAGDGEAGAGAGAGAGRGGGGGGMPDLASLMNDPSIAEMARNMMGGGGAGRGAGGAGRGS